MDIPAHFWKYLLVHQLGAGGMAELFLAKQSGLKGFEKLLAIKKILPHLTQDPEFVSMFVNEAKLAALLTHQHIVQIFDLGHVERALKVFSETSHQFPNHAALHYDLGFLYPQRGLGTLAREELAKAVGLQPEGDLASCARLFLRTGVGARPSGPPPPARAPLKRPGEPSPEPRDGRAVNRLLDGAHQADMSR
jgi:tetratricopeptide (TPR) repeat protein